MPAMWRTSILAGPGPGRVCALGLVVMSSGDVWGLRLELELEAGGFRRRVSWWLDGPLLAARFFLVFLVSFFLNSSHRCLEHA